MAMVDSSVGGKTGLDLPGGKNMVGAFHQPKMVLCDPWLISTLPKERIAEGTAEILKMGILCSPRLFNQIRWTWFADSQKREEVIAEAIRLKAVFVEADERDQGIRHFLNLGHTFGHAIETCSNFTIPHGVAVAYGLICAYRLSERLSDGLFPYVEPSVSDHCNQLLTFALKHNGLPTDTDFSFSAEEMAAAMLKDKKRVGKELPVILFAYIGDCSLVYLDTDHMVDWVKMALGQRANWYPSWRDRDGYRESGLRVSDLIDRQGNIRSRSEKCAENSRNFSADEDPSLEQLRGKINQADDALLSAFVQRMAAARKIGDYKRRMGLPTLDPAREEAVIQRQVAAAPEEARRYVPQLYQTLFKLSREYQQDGEKQ